jgi:hypothetical protein
MSGPATVDVEGSVRFDPERDDVKMLELVRAGEVVFSTATRVRPGEIQLHVNLPIRESTWLALRARGEKLRETTVNLAGDVNWVIAIDRPSNREVLKRVPDKQEARASAAHTSPIYVTIAGMPSIAEQPRASDAAKRWLARLDELEKLLAEKQIGEGDGLKMSDLRAGRAQLMKAIASARAVYRDWATRRAAPLPAALTSRSVRPASSRRP